MKADDLTGRRFGHLIAVKKDNSRVTPSGKKVVIWECICDCGSRKKVSACHLKSEHTTSCGCISREISRTRKLGSGKLYGKGYDRLVNVWKAMLGRCENPNNHAYKNYGGRGISVCEEWHNFSNFQKWMLDNGYDINAETGKTTIDRINNDEGYRPNNCRITTNSIQALNRRSNIIVTYDGNTYVLKELCKKYNFNYQLVHSRLKRGWSIERAVQCTTI